MLFSKLQQFTDKFGIFLIPTFIFPVHPADPVILTIGIVIAVLGISDLIPAPDQRYSPCQTQHRHCVAHLLFPDLFYKLPAGGSLNAIIRTVIPVVSIQIFLAVITIMLLVIRKYIR